MESEAVIAAPIPEPEGPPMLMQGPSMLMQGPPMSLQGPPMSFQGPPMSLQGPPVNLQAPPTGFQSLPMTLQTQSMNLQPQSMNLQPQPIGLQSQPMSLQSQPMSLQPQPTSLQSQPMVLQSQPMSQSQPLTLQAPPMSLQSSPMSLQTQPMNHQAPPMGLQSPPIGLQSSPMTLHPPPTNQESPGDPQPPPTTTGLKRGRDDESPGGDKKWAGWPGDNVFRLVVPVQKVGGIIGRKGEFVKKMCEETRARIKILEGVPGTSERIVLVSAKEDPDLAISPAMEGLLRVHRRVVEGGDLEPDDVLSEPRAGGGTVVSRLLVAATQAGSLIGRQGATIKSIQDASGAMVRVLPQEDLPLCALQDDRVVEIQGEARSIHRAMELVVSHLRKFLVDRTVLTLFEVNRAVTASQQVQQQPTPQQSWGGHSHSHSHSSANSLSNSGVGHGSLSNSSHYGSAAAPSDNHSYYQNPPEMHHESHHHHHGVSMYGRDPGVGSIPSSVTAPPPAPVITQMTQHMQIPLSYADAIIGTAGANISYMRRTSGATITIQETRGVPGEMTVEIHGSAAQVQTAQQLVQNFMAGASGAPQQAPSTYNSSVDQSYTSYPTQSSLYSSAATNTGHAAPTGYASHYNGTYGY